MNRFAELLDRLAYEHGRNNKLRLMTEYFRITSDPERGWALAALTGVLSFPHAKAGLIRSLIAERTDPVLFELSYDYVGDLSETVALMWPASSLAQRTPSVLAGEGRGWGSGGPRTNVDGCDAIRPTLIETLPTPAPIPSLQGGGEERAAEALTLTSVIETLSTLGKAQLPKQLARWLDALDETGPLGADQAGHRRPAHRRLGTAGESRRRGTRRQGSAGDRAALARPRAALSRSVRVARRQERQAGERRSGAVPAADAGACA